MWRFKPFMQKEQTGLEGRVIDIDNFKVQVRNMIADGGFSCVYSARDAIHGNKQYALKHIICNDEESQELVTKEISVMKTLKGHPNIVTLCAHAIFDIGRTRETFLLMEYCEKSLVNVLESRGAGFFEEKQILAIFQDVCNAVFAMHCHTPPIAHRDLKAENLLLGSDGSWKLCDFGSTSTNHKRFEKPEEMGIEEDNIRKYTTPAYRAPEMWDLFRREIISEKVDIWALGCLLFRICYFKSAFDGESKLQILNGNYRIPDLPTYSQSLTNLIKDMLQSSPNDRPDITQVWFRVNSFLPDGSQKSLPDRPPEGLQHGISKSVNVSNPMPRRSPPPPPSVGARNVSSVPDNLRTSDTGGFGSFWDSEHAKGSISNEDDGRQKYDEENHTSSGRDNADHEKHAANSISVNIPSNVSKNYREINLFPDDLNRNAERLKPLKPGGTPASQNDAFNAFVTEFSTNQRTFLHPGSNGQKSEREEILEAELGKLQEQLVNAHSEKAEITSKYEKLSAICRSQRQEIQDLKQTLAARTPSPSKDSSRNIAPPVNQSSTPLNEKQGILDRNSPSPDPQKWRAFSDDPRPQSTPFNNTPKYVRTRNSPSQKQAGELSYVAPSWGFGSDNFTADPAIGSKSNASINVGGLSKSQRFGESNSMTSKLDSQPAGWAGF